MRTAKTAAAVIRIDREETSTNSNELRLRAQNLKCPCLSIVPMMNMYFKASDFNNFKKIKASSIYS